MKRIIALLGALSLSLAACSQPGSINTAGNVAASTADLLGFKVPATLTNTAADEKAISAAWLVFEGWLKIERQWRQSGRLVPGTPKALAVANGIDRVTAGLQAASAARRALSADKYKTAWRDASVAFADAQRALTGG